MRPPVALTGNLRICSKRRLQRRISGLLKPDQHDCIPMKRDTDLRQETLQILAAEVELRRIPDLLQLIAA